VRGEEKMRKCKILLLFALILVTVTGFVFPQKIYINKEFNVSLKYPQGWTEQAGYFNRFSGKDGFFQIDALGGGDDFIDTVAKMEAYQNLKPYGSVPTTEKLIIDGEEGRLIIPSKDQLAEMKGQAALIVKYPKKIVIGSANYIYLILWADKNHIREIGNSIKFIKK
jgi:hypothetical protein